jgi:secretion/DNA translocation related TadE-like protein
LTDRGSATVFVVIGLVLVLFAGSTVAAIGGLVVAHRHAQSAADLAAIAGAEAVGTPGDPCAAAAAVAAANDAAIEACQTTADDITLTVSVAGPDLIGTVVRPRAVARAGR